MSIALVAIIAIVLITVIISFTHPLKISSSSMLQDRVGAVTASYDEGDNGGGYGGGTGGTITPPKVVKSFADCKPHGICDVNNYSLINSVDSELVLESLIGESIACSGADKVRCDLNVDGQVTLADLEVLSAILP